MKENYCILAGGCFWCIAMPYYELDGVVKVYSGYGGGKEVNPSYKEVKNQKTSHKECIKIVYDEEKVSFKEILEIYFNHINPFDSEGQFIDFIELSIKDAWMSLGEILGDVKDTELLDNLFQNFCLGK